jgi:hypothetical protein
MLILKNNSTEEKEGSRLILINFHKKFYFYDARFFSKALSNMKIILIIGIVVHSFPQSIFLETSEFALKH